MGQKGDSNLCFSLVANVRKKKKVINYLVSEEGETLSINMLFRRDFEFLWEALL